MPAKSQAQQRLMALAMHKPGEVYAKNKGVLEMSVKDLHEYAKTKRKGLPKRAKKGKNALRAMVGED